MPRRKRIRIPGALYHIFNRGVEKKNIFLDETDRIKFLDLINTTLKNFNFKIYAYVLMPNHFHLLLEDIDGNISQIMKIISENYTMYFNYKYKRVGHLFQDRYKSIIVEKKFFLKDLVRYIILNPIRAGIAKNLNEYKWSSYYEYMGKNKKFHLTTTDWIYSYFNKDKNKAIILFKQYLVDKDDISAEIITESLFRNIILVTKEYKDKIKRKLNVDKKNLRKIFKYTTVEKTNEIIKRICEEFKINENDIKKKKDKYNYAKKILIYMLKRYTSQTIDEIGKYFNIHPTNISKIYNSVIKEIKHNSYLLKKIQDLEQKI